MRWPWRSGAEAKPGVGADGLAPSPAGWAFLPPLQRTIGDIQPTTAPATFPYELPAWRNPSFIGRMTHAVSAQAPSGVIDGDGAGTGTPTTTRGHAEMPLPRQPSAPAVQRQPAASRPAAPRLSTTMTSATVQRTAMPHVEYAAAPEAGTGDPLPQAPEAGEPVTDDVPTAGSATPEIASAPGPVSTGFATEGATSLPIRRLPTPRLPIQRDAEPAAAVAPEVPSVDPTPAAPARGVRLGLGAPLPADPPAQGPIMPVAVQRAAAPAPAPSGEDDDSTLAAQDATEDPASARADSPVPADPPAAHLPTAIDTSASLLGDRAPGRPPAVGSDAPAPTTPTLTVSRTATADAPNAGPAPAHDLPALTVSRTGATDTPTPGPAPAHDLPTLTVSRTAATDAREHPPAADQSDHELLGTASVPARPSSQPGLAAGVPVAALDLVRTVPGGSSADPDAPVLGPELPGFGPSTPPAADASGAGPTPPAPAPVALAAAQAASVGLAVVQRLAANSVVPPTGFTSHHAPPTTALPPVQRQVGLLAQRVLAPTVPLVATPGSPVWLSGPFAPAAGTEPTRMPTLAGGPGVETPVAPAVPPPGDVPQRSDTASPGGLPLRLQRDAAPDPAPTEPAAEAPEPVPAPAPAPAAVAAVAGAGTSDHPGQPMSAASGGTAGATGPTTPEQLDDLARRLMGPLTRRLKAEMILDRERRGMRVDLR